MLSGQNPRTLFRQALALKEQGQVEQAGPLLQTAAAALRQDIAEDDDNAQLHLILARVLENLDDDEADLHYQMALRLDPTDDVIVHAYEDFKRKLSTLGSAPAAAGDAPDDMADERGVEPPAADTLDLGATAPGAGAPPEFPTGETGGEPEEQASPDGAAPSATPPPPSQRAPTAPAPVTAGEATAGPTTAPADGAAPREVEGAYILGKMRLGEGDEEGAEDAFQNALAHAPSHVKSLAAYSRLLLTQERYPEAKTQLLALQAVAPERVAAAFEGLPQATSVAALTLRAELAEQRTDWAEAELFRRQVYAATPQDPAALRALTRVLQQQGQTGDAAALLKQAFDQGVESFDLYQTYVELLARQHNFEELNRALKRVEKQWPMEPGLAALKQTYDQRRRAYIKARNLTALAQSKSKPQDSGEPSASADELASIYEEAYTSDPHYLPLLYAYTAFLKDHGQLSRALGLWTTVMDIAPEVAARQREQIIAEQLTRLTAGDLSRLDPGMLGELVTALVAAERLSDAETVQRHLLSLQPDNPRVLQDLVSLLEGQGRRPTAEQVLREHRKVVDQDAALCETYARLFEARREIEKAGQYYEKAVKLASDKTALHEKLDAIAPQREAYENANLEMASGWESEEKDEAGAIQHYETALQLFEDHPPTLQRYATLLEKRGRHGEAGKLWLRLADFEPDKILSRYKQMVGAQAEPAQRCSYAGVLAKTGQVEEALAQYELVLASRADDLDALEPYVELRRQRGDLGHVARVLKRAVAQAPQNAKLKWLYGQALVERGRYDLALDVLRQAHSLSGEPSVVAQDKALMGLYDQVMQASGPLRDAEAARAAAWQAPPDRREEFFQEALESYPDDIQTLRAYAAFLWEQGRADEAVAHVQRALAEDEHDDETRELLNLYQAASRAPGAETGQPAPAVESRPQ